MSKGQTLQDPFLNSLRKDRIPVSIFLVNGIKLQGHIESFDQYVVLLKNTVSQMVYKHAISTVVPARNPRNAGTSPMGMQSSTIQSSAMSSSGFQSEADDAGFNRGGFSQERGFNRGGFAQERGFERGGFTQERGFDRGGFAQERGFDRGGFAQERKLDNRKFDGGFGQERGFNNQPFDANASRLEGKGFQETSSNDFNGEDDEN